MIDWPHILIAAGVKPATAANWRDAFARIVTPDRFSLGAKEMDDWLGQVLHESAMLERVEEGLRYSAQRLMAVWPKRFPTLTEAQKFAGQPEALANYVYGGRLGNTQPGDGYRYRGRGLIQVTGRENYAALGARMGLPLVDNPDLLLQPETALQSAIVWWEGHVPDAFVNDPVRVRKAVNGGTVGLDETKRLTAAVDAADGKTDGALE